MIKRGGRVLVTRERLEAIRMAANALGITESEALERVVWVRATVVSDEEDAWGYEVQLATDLIVRRSPKEVKPYSAIDALADLHRCEGCIDHGPDRCNQHHTNCPDGIITWKMVDGTSNISTVALDLKRATGGSDVVRRKPRDNAAWRDFLPRSRRRRRQAMEQHGPGHHHHEREHLRRRQLPAGRGRPGRRGYKAR